ncbi:MAG: DsbA family protein [Chloroflexi bacterium]|nr:DsbA family protein [Chloroflexota bacterium]
MGLERVERLAQDYPVEVEWRPYLLRPDAPPEGSPLPPHLATNRQQRHERLRAMAVEAGLPISAEPRAWISSSWLAHEAAVYAREAGQDEAFRRAVFRAYWAEGRDIGKVDVLAALAESVGLDPEPLRQALAEGRYRAQVIAAVQEAYEYGINGVPTTFVGDEVVVGAQPYAAFREAAERTLAR